MRNWGGAKTDDRHYHDDSPNLSGIWCDLGLPRKEIFQDMTVTEDDRRMMKHNRYSNRFFWITHVRLAIKSYLPPEVAGFVDIGQIDF